MTSSKFATCKFCGERIRWTRTTGNRKIPINPEPVTTGKFGLVLNGDDAPPLLVAAQDHHQLRYDRHYCPTR